MSQTSRRWRDLAIVLASIATVSTAGAAELNPAAVAYKLPDQIPWGPVNAAGAQSAVVLGDPAKPGFYMVYNRWTKGNHFSRPHFHPNDRFIVVLQGTWWVGTGPKFDPANTTPMPPGSFVTHFARQLHLGRRQGRGRRAADHRRRSGHIHGGRRERNTGDD